MTMQWRVLGLFLMCLLQFGLNASAQGFIWASQIGESAIGIAPPYPPTRTKLAVDPSGNVYVVGSFQGTANFGPTNLTSSGSTDAYVAKYSNTGVLSWVKQIGGTGQDTGGDVVVDGSGNVYVIGTFQGSATFDSTNLITPGNYDLFLAKYASDGTLLWAQRGFGSGGTQGLGLDVQTNGDIFCTGSVGTSIMIEKRDPLGTVIWHKELPEVANYNFLNQGNRVQIDSSGNAFVVGEFGTSVDFGTNTLSTDYFQAVFLTKIDPDGNFVWARQAGSSVNDVGLSLALDGSGNALITGAFTQTIQFPGTNLITLQSGGTDAFVAKYDPAGNFLWVRQISKFSNNTGFGIAADAKGNSYLTGYVFPSQAFVSKYDQDGNLQWNILPGVTGASSGYGVAVGPSNRVYVATWATGGISFDNLVFTNMQGGDVFVASISEEVPPVFITEPISTRPGFLGGNNYTLTTAVRSVVPVSYQWFFNGTNLLNATNTTLTITNAQLANNGSYQVVASNLYGTATSSVATIAVYYKLTVLTDGSGTLSNSPPSKSPYLGNSVVTLTAVTNANVAFAYWSGDVISTNASISLQMTNNLLVIGSFADAITNITIDDLDPRAAFTGAWTNDTISTMFEADYRFTAASTSLTANVVYRPQISVPGYYDILVWYPQGGQYSSKAPFSVSYRDGTFTTNVNQRLHGGTWSLIASGRYFTEGTNGYVGLSNATGEPPFVQVVADAVRFLPSAAPGLSVPLQDQSAAAGGSLTFRVFATGSPPLLYQWLFNGKAIPGATQSSFTIYPVENTNAGNYSVIVSNFLGVFTSTSALLTVTPPSPPQLALSRSPVGAFDLMLSGDPGVLFAIQTSTNLIDWVTLTNVLNSTGTTDFTDAVNTNDYARFYRVSWPAQ